MNRYGRHLSLALAIACLGLAVLAAGALGASFGDGGQVLTGFGSRAVTRGSVEDLALAADGRIAVAVKGEEGLPAQIAVLGPDGSLDRAFSGDGVIQPQLEAGRPFRRNPVRVRIAFAGEDLLVAGGIKEPGGDAVAIREYGPDGDLVHGFGADGVAVAQEPEVGALFVQPSGDIALFADGEFVAPEGFLGGGLVRFSADGRELGTTTAPDANDFGRVAMEPDGGFLAAADNGEEPGLTKGALLRLGPGGKVLAGVASGEAGFLTDRLLGVDAEGAGLAYVGGAVTRLGSDLRSVDPSFDGSALPCAASHYEVGFERALPSVGGTTLLAGICGLVRVHADGSPDTSFGSGGLVATELARTPLAVAADGSVVYATWSAAASGPEVVRLAPDGSPDPAFGTAGHATFNLSAPYSAAARAVVALPGGRGFIAAGDASCGEGCGGFALARYGRDGHLDRGFGTDGKDLITSEGLGGAHAVALTPGGRIVAVGTTAEGLGPQAFALAEVGRNGAPVRGFGHDGVVVEQVRRGSKGRSEANAVAVQPNGRIVVAGFAEGCKKELCFTVARYLPDGAPDKSFGQGGILRLGGMESSAKAIAFAPDGKIVVAGGDYGHFVVVRLTSRGRLDRTFGHGGIIDRTQRIRFHKPGRELIDLGVGAEALSVSRRGAITVAGSTGGAHTVIERYGATGKLVRGFGHAGRVTITGFGVAALRPTACGLVAAGSFQRHGREEQMGLLRIAASGRGHTAPRALFGPLRQSTGAALALVDGRVVVAGQVRAFVGDREFALAGLPLKSLGSCS